MPSIPDYIVTATTALLSPFVHASEDDVRRALATLDTSRRATATLGAIARAWGVPRKTAYARLHRAGIEPVARNGGRTGREAVFNLEAVAPFAPSFDAAS